MLSANTNRLDARQATPRDVFAACDTLSMFGGGRLVIVEGALGQAGGRGGGTARRHCRVELEPALRAFDKDTVEDQRMIV